MTGYTDGIVIVDKPLAMTSHDVVGRMRRVLGMRRVGHAGTLDPDASGVLVLGFGRGTRLLTYLVGDDKDYTASIRLGAATTTDDAAGEILTRATRADVLVVSDDAISAAATELTGNIQQRPSAVSAVKVDGVRAYARVRAGEDVALPAREVTVYKFNIRSITHDDHAGWIDVTADFTVSSGTYIRALARDLGAALGVGGHLTSLRRTRSGKFSEVDAIALPDQGDELGALSLAQAMHRCLMCVEVDEAAARSLGHGRSISLPAGAIPSDDEVDTNVSVGLTCGDTALAVATVRDGLLHPSVVFEPATSA